MTGNTRRPAVEGPQGRDRQQICMALTVHAQIEEEIFYPAAREASIVTARTCSTKRKSSTARSRSWSPPSRTPRRTTRAVRRAGQGAGRIRQAPCEGRGERALPQAPQERHGPRRGRCAARRPQGRADRELRATPDPSLSRAPIRASGALSLLPHDPGPHMPEPRRTTAVTAAAIRPELSIPTLVTIT